MESGWRKQGPGATQIQKGGIGQWAVVSQGMPYYNCLPSTSPGPPQKRPPKALPIGHRTPRSSVWHPHLVPKETLTPGTCLSRGGVQRRGGGGPGGSPPRPPCRNREQKNYWRMNNSAHGNVMLSAVNKGNSSLNVNSGFPHLTNTQQLQQSGTFTISCQIRLA